MDSVFGKGMLPLCVCVCVCTADFLLIYWWKHNASFVSCAFFRKCLSGKTVSKLRLKEKEFPDMFKLQITLFLYHLQAKYFWACLNMINLEISCIFSFIAPKFRQCKCYRCCYFSIRPKPDFTFPFVQIKSILISFTQKKSKEMEKKKLASQTLRVWHFRQTPLPSLLLPMLGQ